MAVFLNREILFLQAGHGGSVRVRHGEEYIHQLDIDFKGSCWFRLLLRIARLLLFGWLLLCARGDVDQQH